MKGGKCPVSIPQATKFISAKIDRFIFAGLSYPTAPEKTSLQCTKKSDAKAWADNELKEKYSKYGQFVIDSTTTLLEFTGTDFFKLGGKYHRSKKKNSRYSEQQALYKNRELNKHILPALGALQFSQLNNAVISKFVDDKKDVGYSDNFVNKLIFDIASICKIAQSEGIIFPIPNFQQHTFSLQGNRKSSLSALQVLQLESMHWKSKQAYIAVMIAIYGGLRLSEVLALQIKNISGGWIHIEKSYNVYFSRLIK